MTKPMHPIAEVWSAMTGMVKRIAALERALGITPEAADRPGEPKAKTTASVRNGGRATVE